MISSERGFLLAEVLVALLILAVAFTAFMGALAQVLKVSDKANHTTDALSALESLLFEVESGTRSDLAAWGGQGSAGELYRFRIEAQGRGSSALLETRLSWKEGREFLDSDLLVLLAPVQ